jgi:hypothetical protein
LIGPDDKSVKNDKGGAAWRKAGPQELIWLNSMRRV